jgi:hypothetical protein
VGWWQVGEWKHEVQCAGFLGWRFLAALRNIPPAIAGSGGSAEEVEQTLQWQRLLLGATPENIVARVDALTLLHPALNFEDDDAGKRRRDAALRSLAVGVARSVWDAQMKDVAVVDALDAYSEACRGLVQFGELTRGGGKRALGALPEDAPRPKGGGAAKAAAKAQRAKADALARTKHRVARAAFAEHEATVCRNPPRGAQIDYQKPVQVVAPSTA